MVPAALKCGQSYALANHGGIYNSTSCPYETTKAIEHSNVLKRRHRSVVWGKSRRRRRRALSKMLTKPVRPWSCLHLCFQRLRGYTMLWDQARHSSSPRAWVHVRVEGTCEHYCPRPMFCLACISRVSLPSACRCWTPHARRTFIISILAFRFCVTSAARRQLSTPSPAPLAPLALLPPPPSPSCEPGVALPLPAPFDLGRVR